MDGRARVAIGAEHENLITVFGARVTRVAVVTDDLFCARRQGRFRRNAEPHESHLAPSPETEDAVQARPASLFEMEAAGLDLALMVFEHTGGAEHAYSRAPREVAGVAWANEIAFVEHHRRDRIVVRGTFAGHYVDADDEQQFVGKKVAEGAAAGGAVGALLGPAGLAAGLVAGGMAGGGATEHSASRLRSALFDEVRREAPQGFSAVILLASPQHIDAMQSALEGQHGRLVRHRLSPQATQALRAAVADSPSAAPRP